MRQLSLPNMPDKDKIVNISSVPHRSPFRYPGGKTWLIPTIRYWLALLSYQPRHFIEPFAGGGITGLTVAFENMADHVTLVEIDSQVAAVWQTIIEDGQGKWLGQKITEFELTLDRVQIIV